LFKNKKFRARSRFKNPTHRIETTRVQTTYAERKNSVIGKQDNDKDTLPTIITKCLSEGCKDCTGFYRNKFIAHVLCRCSCHKKSKISYDFRPVYEGVAKRSELPSAPSDTVIHLKPKKNKVRQKKQPEQEDYTFSQNQYEDYLSLNGIVNRTGIAKEDSYTFVLKELLDNAVDDVEKSNKPLVEAEISIRNDSVYIVVRNLNESNKVVFSKAKLDSIFNLTKFTSSKRGLFRISRGALGDAMKYILGMPYALAKELHVSIEEAPLTIRTNQQVFSVKLNVHRGDVKGEKQEHSKWTEVEVRLPIVHEFFDFKKIKRFLADYVLFSTHISFKFRVGDETMLFSQTQPNNKKWVNNSSSYYYSQTEFEHFIDKFDDDNADVYTVMQRLFREGSVMKKAGLENMKMGELKRSSKLKKELFLRMRDAIPTPPPKIVVAV
jgi:hypothetical protein